MSRLKRWTREIIFFLLLLVVLSFIMDWLRSPQVPAEWPALQLQTINGEVVSLNTLSQDKPLLVYFWASWCGVCKYTTPSVDQLVTEGNNLMTVALRSGDDQQVARWLAKKGSIICQLSMIRKAGFLLIGRLVLRPLLPFFIRGKWYNTPVAGPVIGV